MTVVAAKKFDDRIITISDTMLSDVAGKSGHEIIPGALKSVVVGMDLTICFAGNWPNGIHIIREARSSYKTDRNLDSVLKLLAGESKDGHSDFIVASHVNGAELRKVWNGAVSNPLENCWIGDPTIAEELLSPRQLNLPPGHELPNLEGEAMGFRINAVELLRKRGTQLGANVGGFLFDQLASPYGHCYQNVAGAMAWDTITLGVGITPEQERARSSGKTQFTYHTRGTQYRGVAVVGAYIEQGSVGFLYDPMSEYRGICLPSITRISFENELDRLAQTAGGNWVE